LKNLDQINSSNFLDQNKNQILLM